MSLRERQRCPFYTVSFDDGRVRGRLWFNFLVQIQDRYRSSFVRPRFWQNLTGTFLYLCFVSVQLADLFRLNMAMEQVEWVRFRLVNKPSRLVKKIQAHSFGKKSQLSNYSPSRSDNPSWKPLLAKRPIDHDRLIKLNYPNAAQYHVPIRFHNPKPSHIEASLPKTQPITSPETLNYIRSGP